MKKFQALGSTFCAFVAGTVVSVGTSAYAAILLSDTVPGDWPLLLAATLVLVSGGLLWAYLSLVLTNLDESIRRLPSSIDYEDRQQMADELAQSVARRTRLASTLAIVLTVGGLAGLPIRFLL